MRQTYQEQKVKLRRKLKKRKALGLKCYGFLLDGGSFEGAKFAYGSYAYVCSRNKKNYFVNAEKKADWLCVSTFKNSRLGRTKENISHILCCFLDLDGPYTAELDGEKIILQLTDDLIRRRCNLLGLPMPLIIETSPGRFHVKFYFKSPVPVSKKEYVKAVQKLLHRAFKDMGADPLVTEDLTRFLRNENQENSVNKKYPNKPAVVIREKGQYCTLSELYQILKRHGYTQYKAQGSKKPRRARQIPFHISQYRIIAFLRANNGIITTYKELFEACNVSESTGYLLLKGLKIITTETVRVGRTWKTRFTLRVDTLTKENLTPTLNFIERKKRFLDVVRRVSRVGFPGDWRNKGVFMVALGLKVCGFSDPDTLRMLGSGFSLSNFTGVHKFSAREFKKTVESALSDKYRYCVAFDNSDWDWDGFLKAITNLECQMLRKIESRGETWSCFRDC